MGKKSGKVTRAAEMPPGQPGHVTNPVTWSGWPWQDGWVPRWDPQSPWLVERIALVYSCIDRVAAALSSMPLRVSKDSEPQLPPPWLHNPSPDVYTHAGDAIGEIVWSLLMRGNAWIAPTVNYAPDRYGNTYPREWAVLNPDRVRWDERERVWWVSIGATDQMFQARDLYHIRHSPRPGSRLGVAPLSAAASNLEAAASYERVASKLARNSGIPTQGILSTDQDIPATTAQRYKATWQARGDGEVAVLGAGLKYQALTLNPRDLALLELREFDGRQIASAFGVPPFMVNLAAAGDLTYSTTQGMMDYFWRQTLRPMASNIGRALGTMLPGRSTVLFDADEYTRGTHSELVHTLVEGSGGPVMTQDEARVALNLSPLGGDEQAAVLAQVTGGQ
jgi:HK97 family phage portal protein